MTKTLGAGCREVAVPAGLGLLVGLSACSREPSPEAGTWLGLIARTVVEAQAAGEVRADVDAEQLAFDLAAYLDSANLRSLLLDSSDVYAQARAAAARRLEESAA